MKPYHRGYLESPLLDADHEPTTRAELLAGERLGDTGWADLPERANVTIDPALVGIVARLQRAVRR